MSEMTISDALRRKARIKGELKVLVGRMNASATHYEEDIPAFSFEDSKKEYLQLESELVDLNARVALSNATTRLSTGITLAEAVAKLNSLKSSIAAFKTLGFLSVKRKVIIEKERSLVDGKLVETKRERTQVSAMTEKECDEWVKSLEKEFDTINGMLERANQTTKLANLRG